MRKIEKYYENTADANPNYIVKKFIELKIGPGNAVELGCGAGRDTIYLIKNGWILMRQCKQLHMIILGNCLRKYLRREYESINNKTTLGNTNNARR